MDPGLGAILLQRYKYNSTCRVVGTKNLNYHHRVGDCFATVTAKDLFS